MHAVRGTHRSSRPPLLASAQTLDVCPLGVQAVAGRGHRQHMLTFMKPMIYCCGQCSFRSTSNGCRWYPVWPEVCATISRFAGWRLAPPTPWRGRWLVQGIRTKAVCKQRPISGKGGRGGRDVHVGRGVTYMFVFSSGRTSCRCGRFSTATIDNHKVDNPCKSPGSELCPNCQWWRAGYFPFVSCLYSVFEAVTM